MRKLKNIHEIAIIRDNREMKKRAQHSSIKSIKVLPLSPTIHIFFFYESFLINN